MRIVPRLVQAVFILLPAFLVAQTDPYANINFRKSVFSADLKKVFSFRNENVGNLFIYDVPSNLVIKNLKVSDGVVKKVFVHEKEFLVATSKDLIVYDLTTFTELKRIAFGFALPADGIEVKEDLVMIKKEKTGKMKGLLKKEETVEPPKADWMKVEADVYGDLLYAYSSEEKIGRIWNWRSGMLLKEINFQNDPTYAIKETKFTFLLNYALLIGGETPRVYVIGGKTLSVFDSNLNHLRNISFSSRSNYVGLTKDQKLVYTSSFELKGLTKFEMKYKVFDLDLTTEKYNYEYVVDFSIGTSFAMDELKMFSDKYMVIQTPPVVKKDENRSQHFNHNRFRTKMVDVTTKQEFRSFDGQFADISKDGKYILLSRMDQPMPDYDDGSYKKLLRKKYEMMWKYTRGAYEFGKSLNELRYYEVIDLSTGQSVYKIRSAEQLEFINDRYLLENSVDNGGLRLYDIRTGTLVKEI